MPSHLGECRLRGRHERHDYGPASSAWRLVLLVCVAQTLVQIGAFFWPALLPRLAPQSSLSNSAAGWITAAFYGAYMLAVPVLVTLTRRVDPKPFSCWAWV